MVNLKSLTLAFDLEFLQDEIEKRNSVIRKIKRKTQKRGSI